MMSHGSMSKGIGIILWVFLLEKIQGSLASKYKMTGKAYKCIK